MENNPDFSSILEFVDIGENDEAIAIVKVAGNSVGLTLSLKHGSDTEVFMRHADGVRFLEMLRKAIQENEARVIHRIEMLIAAELPNLSPNLKTWVEQHRIVPHQMAFSTSEDGTGEIILWLITDNLGKNDSPNRIVFDEITESFGFVMSMPNDIQYFMGFYGNLVKTLDAM